VPWLLRNIYLLGPNMVFGDDGNIDSRVTGQSLVNIGAHINYTQTNPLLVIQEQGYWFYWLALQSFKLIAFPLSIFFFLGVIFALLRLIKGLKYSIIQNKKIFLFFIFELYLIGFFSFSHPGINYLTPLIPIMVILSAFFIILLSSLTVKIISLLIEKYPDVIPFKVNKLYAIKIFIAASVLCIVLISFLRWSDLIISTRPSYQNYHIKEAGLWIRHNTPEDSIISCERREIVFYAGRYWTPSKGLTLEDLQMKEINYLVVFPDDSWGYLMDIENAPKYLKPVRISQNRFVIYEFIYQ